MSQAAIFGRTIRRYLSRPRRMLTDAVVYLIVAAILVWSLFPVLYAFVTSIKTVKEIYTQPYRLIPENPTFLPYKYILLLSPTFPRQMLNSIIVALGSVALTVVMATMGGYSFSRLDWRLRDLVFYSFIVCMFIPRAGTLMAQYELMEFLHLRNSLVGLILSFGAGLAVPIFVMRQTFLNIPRELEESAYIDGAGTWTVMWRIAVPLSTGGMLVVAILKFVQVWGNYLFVLTMIDKQELYLVSMSIAIINLLTGSDYQDIDGLFSENVAAAAYVTVMIPVVLLYVFLQKWFVRGLREGALKF